MAAKQQNKQNKPKGTLSLETSSLLVSVVNLVLFHYPFFSYVTEHINCNFNGILICLGLGVIMLAANYFATYLVLHLGRLVGKVLIALSFIGNAISLYFIRTYDVMLDDSMMGNVFNTNYGEATSYASFTALWYVLLLGLLPALLVFLVKIRYGSWKRFGANIGIALLTIVVVAFANMSNWTWIDKNATVIGSLLLPWSYVVNAIRYQSQQHEKNREEILLPDATIASNDKAAVVLVIGESARQDHFALYGYARNTNPLLAKTEGLSYYKANASATYTTGGVKAILEPIDSNDLYEILPNYLYRTGVDVYWRSSNWGEPPLHINPNHRIDQNGSDYDELLCLGIDSLITHSSQNKVFIVVHTSTSHGPTYYKKYPPAFEKFSPVCQSVEMSECSKQEVLNAYDNSILYTDYILHLIIEQLKGLTDWKTSMIYVSDHGESLGENNLYMHGVPLSLAPREQIEIPLLVWSNQATKQQSSAGQHHVFHSVLRFLDIQSPSYNENLNLFK